MKFAIFYLSFVVFVGDCRMKAKNLKKTWIKNGEFLILYSVSNIH